MFWQRLNIVRPADGRDGGPRFGNEALALLGFRVFLLSGCVTRKISELGVGFVLAAFEYREAGRRERRRAEVWKRGAPDDNSPPLPTRA